VHLLKSLKLSVLLALGVFAAVAAVAVAETTRDAYVAAVEPICKTNSDANARILKGVRTMVKQGKLGPAATKFKKAGAALTKAEQQIAAVEQPSADAKTLSKWLGYLKAEASLLNKISKALSSGNKNKASTLVITLQHDANLANSTVIVFGFHYCKQTPSKYT
jgi:hypothetical protein